MRELDSNIEIKLKLIQNLYDNKKKKVMLKNTAIHNN